MTVHAWLVTTWGRIRETLQPELWALRRKLSEVEDERDDWKMECLRANSRADLLSERLAQRTRELKAARAKLRAKA